MKAGELFSLYTEGVIVANAVQVKYPLDRDTWQKVVEESHEEMFIEHEGSDTFTIEYANQEEFNHALARFQGLVEYTVIE